jgi:hypothetical protein
MNEVELLRKIAKYVQLAHDMRRAQKEYFRTRTKDDLVKSKGLEAKIDTQNAEILQVVGDLLFVANEVQKHGGKDIY